MQTLKHFGTMSAVAFALIALMPLISSPPRSYAALGKATGDMVFANQYDSAEIQKTFDQLPLYFIENQGQVDAAVAYYIQGSDKTLYFTPQGVTFVIAGKRASPPALSSAELERAVGSAIQEQRWTLKLDFVGANRDVQPEAHDPAPALISYFKGSRDQWKVGLKTFSSIVYRDLWPGIDLVYSGTVNQLKYTFIVKSGADPAQIKLAYRGASKVTLNEEGQLQISTPLGGFNDAKPYAYQEVGKRVQVAASYSLHADNAQGTHTFGFSLGAYDSSKPLILDPAVLVYAGFIGGSGEDRVQSIAVDSSGNAYVTGYTVSTEATFPVTVGPDMAYNGNPFDAFVAKVKADGTGLAYAGYIGGSGQDNGLGIAVDSGGNAYVTGNTLTTQATFPVTVGPDLTYNGGSNGDAFVAKVNAAGTALVYCGYIGGNGGGSGQDQGNAIAVDSTGNAYVAGSTQSDEATFPVSGGPDLTYNGGSFDAFIAKVKADGTGLDYAGYIGGSAFDSANGIAVDSGGNSYPIGTTTSSEATFPATVGPDLTYNGGDDFFIAKVKADGTGLDYAGYIGGSGNDSVGAVAVGSGGSAFVAGTTGSTEGTFPVIGGPDLTYNGGTFDSFVAKVKADGTGLDYAGYIGGSDYEEGHGIGVDGAGNAYVGGFTASTEATFPLSVGPDLTYNGGGFDAFIAMVKADGTGLDYAGYIGGSGNEFGGHVAVDSAGNAYVGGSTDSTEATFSVTVGPDLTYNGGAADGFVVKVGTLAPPTYTFTGFFQPIDNLPTLNTVKAGSAVPVKFSLGGNQGLDIFAAGYPASITTSCGTTAADAVEQTVTAGSSSLSYDAATDQYTYVWKTSKAWAGTCRTLVVKLDDNTIHRADFKFK